MQYEYGLTEEQIKLIQERCQAIIDAFVPDQNYGSPNTMYVVSKYNEQFPNEVIGGNIYEYAMSISFEEQPQEEA
ncbi:hypothetical protein [Priestia megaterium]|uniref:hypothetical protein n=1 Tax=Priestia megaterium TaxID=1404 RepID=UPI002858ED11|nr:hypothetical protein [Priestia megaterium]MDR7207592.1 hypothetical protein [Priestia megaterium]